MSHRTSKIKRNIGENMSHDHVNIPGEAAGLERGKMRGSAQFTRCDDNLWRIQYSIQANGRGLTFLSGPWQKIQQWSRSGEARPKRTEER